jgi:hypothetical protein
MALMVAGVEKWTLRSSYLPCATGGSTFMIVKKSFLIKSVIKSTGPFLKLVQKTQGWKFVIVPDSLQLYHICTVFMVILLVIQSIAKEVVQKV